MADSISSTFAQVFRNHKVFYVILFHILSYSILPGGTRHSSYKGTKRDEISFRISFFLGGGSDQDELV